LRIGATVVPLPDDGNGQLPKYHLPKVGMYLRQYTAASLYFSLQSASIAYTENHNCGCLHVICLHVSNSVNNYQYEGMGTRAAVLVCVRHGGEGTIVTAHIVRCLKQTLNESVGFAPIKI
jgi:hypothetical protein